MRVNRLWFSENEIFIETDQKEVFHQSLVWYPSLQKASNEQKQNFQVNYFGIRWEEIDEDISFESFLFDLETNKQNCCAESEVPYNNIQQE